MKPIKVMTVDTASGKPSHEIIINVDNIDVVNPSSNIVSLSGIFWALTPDSFEKVMSEINKKGAK